MACASSSQGFGPCWRHTSVGRTPVLTVMGGITRHVPRANVNHPGDRRLASVRDLAPSRTERHHARADRPRPKRGHGPLGSGRRIGGAVQIARVASASRIASPIRTWSIDAEWTYCSRPVGQDDRLTPRRSVAWTFDQFGPSGAPGIGQIGPLAHSQVDNL